MNNLFISIFLFLTLIFSSCVHSSKNQQQGAETVTESDVPLSFSFISSLPPFNESLETTVLRGINQAIIVDAKAKRKDSTTLYTTKDPYGNISKPKTPEKVKFFAVMSDSTLVAVDNAAQSFNAQDDINAIHAINFNRDFAFVVTHPPVFQKGFYGDHLTMYPLDSATFFVSLIYDFHQDDGPVSTSVWNTSVFKLPKKSFKKLGVILNQDTTFFSLAHKSISN